METTHVLQKKYKEDKNLVCKKVNNMASDIFISKPLVPRSEYLIWVCTECQRSLSKTFHGDHSVSSYLLQKNGILWQ